eukprot:scaffold6290_cov125-Isochrysis_galbana.AAC.4
MAEAALARLAALRSRPMAPSRRAPQRHQVRRAPGRPAGPTGWLGPTGGRTGFGPCPRRRGWCGLRGGGMGGGGGRLGRRRKTGEAGLRTGEPCRETVETLIIRRPRSDRNGGWSRLSISSAAGSAAIASHVGSRLRESRARAAPGGRGERRRACSHSGVKTPTPTAHECRQRRVGVRRLGPRKRRRRCSRIVGHSVRRQPWRMRLPRRAASVEPTHAREAILCRPSRPHRHGVELRHGHLHRIPDPVRRHAIR